MPTTPCSRTALTAAAARAAHLIVDGPPPILADTLAAPLLGERAEELIAYHRRHGDHVVLAGARTQATCRARYTEDRLATAAASGVRQYVILGAGLDTFAYRSPLAAGLRTFEVDHPATQRWKREHLAGAGIAEPATVRYVPADLTATPLADRLRAAGFDHTEPAVVSCLGVSMYLTADALAGVLRTVGRFASGTELILDHMLPEPDRDALGQTYADLVAPFAAERGEPWLTLLSPDDLAARCADAGLEVVEQVRQHDLAAAHWPRTDALRPADLSRLASIRPVPERAVFR